MAEYSPNPLMAKADFLSGLVFFIIAVFFIYEGLSLPGAGGFIEESGEPGRVVVMLGCIIGAFSLILLFRSITEGGHRLGGIAENVDERMKVGMKRSTVAAVWCSFYAIGMVGSTLAEWRFPYSLATFIFIFGFIAGFEWELAPELGEKRMAGLEKRAAGLASSLKNIFAFLPAGGGAKLWLCVTALMQSAIVTWIVTYVFEQEFYVKLP